MSSEEVSESRDIVLNISPVLPLKNLPVLSSTNMAVNSIQDNSQSLRRRRSSKRPKKVVRTTKDGISPSSGFFRSILIPGWGQYYSGRKTQAALFIAAEVSLWTGMIISQQASVSLQKNYESFAAAHAGFRGSKDHNFYVNIGNYDNRDEFNEAQRGWRQYEDQYFSDEYWWEWDNSQNRETFKDMRIKSDRYENNVYYFIGGLFLNRILSGIEASRGIVKQIRAENIQVGYNPQTQGPCVVWTGWIGK